MDERLETRGFFWSILGFCFQLGSQAVSLLVLSRLLESEVFGIYAICTITLGVGQMMFFLGFGPALIQQKGEVHSLLNVAWTGRVIIGFLAFVVLQLLVGSIVESFDEPSAQLPLRAMLCSLVIVSVNSPALILLHRKVDLRKQFLVDAPGFLFRAVVAICLALLDWGIWALVLGYVSSFIVQTALSYIVCPWRPAFVVRLNELKKLYSFSSWLHAKNLTVWLARNLDSIMVGRILGTEMLGFYNRAYNLAMVPDQQSKVVINRVSFPIFCKIHNSNGDLTPVFARTVDLVLIGLVPSFVVCFLFDKQIVEIILGEGWSISAGILSLLVGTVVVRSVTECSSPAIRAVGVPRYEFLLLLIKVSVTAATVYYFTRNMGLIGAGYSVLLGEVTALPIAFFLVSRVAKIECRLALLSLLSGLVALLATFGCGSFLDLSELDGAVEVVLVSLGAVSIYLALLVTVASIFGASTPGTVSTYWRSVKDQIRSNA